LKIRFDFKSNLTSAIGNFSESQHLASYVSHHNAMAYDTPQPRSLSIILSIDSANYLLIVAFFDQRTATLSQCPPPSLCFFDVACFVVTNKGTSPRECKPSAGHLQQTHREQRRNDLGALLPYP
jgi:hypothetical protein